MEPSYEIAFAIASNINQIEESSEDKPTLGSIIFSNHLWIWKKKGFKNETFV